MNYSKLLEGLYADQLKRVSEVNRYYEIYEGKQGWETNDELDYEPTKKITNYTKKLIDTKARFMFGKEPFLDLRQRHEDAEGQTYNKDMTQEKEDLLAEILRDNRFHSKLIKARKDCSIGGEVAIKLWAHKDKGVKIIFVPTQGYFTRYNIDDVDELEKIVLPFALNDEEHAEDQRIQKQEWEMVDGRCMLTEAMYDGNGELIEVIEAEHDTGLDFIPVIPIRNGGLTGETTGVSDVEQIWQNQDAYNKLTSDDIDSLKFNMFPQRIATDAAESSLENLSIAPGALVDLQTDTTQLSSGNQAKMEMLDSSFGYGDKYIDTVNRLKNDMFDVLDVPNVSLDQLKGLMTSGKSMRALYWGLITACEEDWVEWGGAMGQMVEYIFRMVDIYDLYDARELARHETVLEIEYSYPIREDEVEAKQIDLEEVVTGTRSRESYIDKWSTAESVKAELEQIQEERRMMEDSYTRDIYSQLDGMGD